MIDREVEDAADEAVAPSGKPESAAEASETVGIGSALAIGCIALLIVAVVIAVALRWLTGIW